MGEVWSARNVLTNRDFAIKLLLPQLATNPAVLHRFVSEARATGQLSHPSLVNVFDAGRTNDGRPYLVMELLEGESLEHLLKRRGRLDALTTCLYLAQVARALATAHAAGIVHRDLSSANVFLVKRAEGEEPLPKVLDFGVSKFMNVEKERRVRTGDGAVLGSPEYMSPEQACGAENTDARTDVWALGVLLYECLGGKVPFSAPNYNTMMLAIINEPHEPLTALAFDVDPGLAALVDRCLAKDREQRVQTASEVGDKLERIAMRLAAKVGDGRFTPRRRATDRVSRISLLPPPPATEREPEQRARTSRTLLAAGSALGGTALGIAIGMALASSRAPNTPVVVGDSTGLEPSRAESEAPSVTRQTFQHPAGAPQEQVPARGLADEERVAGRRGPPPAGR